MSSHRCRSAAAAIALAMLSGCAPDAGDPARSSATEIDFERLLETGESLYSQNKEELIIRHFFADRREGVFVDVGASHWKKESTTLYLEKHLGWTGIAVEPLEKLKIGYDKHRPGTRFFAYAAGDSVGETVTLHVAGPISSTDPDWKRNFDIPEQELPTIEVPSTTLDDLLDRAAVTRIDLLSMDIEGAEVEALQGFDLLRFAPELVCVEVGWDNRPAVREYFEARGYEKIEAYRAHDRVNWYFRRSPGESSGGPPPR